MMTKAKIPAVLKEWFRSEGIRELAEFLELPPRLLPVFIVPNAVNKTGYPIPTMLGGSIPDLYSTATVTVGNSFTTETKTVPANKRWLVFAASLSHDDSVAHTLTIEVYDENDHLVFRWGRDSGGDGNVSLVNVPTRIIRTESEYGCDGLTRFPLKAGWYLSFSASGVMTDASVIWQTNACVLEFDV